MPSNLRNDVLSAPNKLPESAGTVFRRVFDTTQVLSWTTDKQGFCTALNKDISDELRGLGPLTTTDWMRFVHPDDIDSVLQVMEIARINQEDYQHEYRAIRADGTIRWLFHAGAPRYSKEGVFEGYTGTVIDVTSRHEAFDRLAKSEAEYRLLAEHTSDLICRCDSAGKYLYLSPSYAKLLGIDPVASLGRSAFETIHPDDADSVKEEVERIKVHGVESRVLEVRKKHVDGHYLWAGIKIHGIYDPVTRALSGTVTVSRDISQERLAREKLRRSEERFRKLVHLSSDWYWETDERDVLTYASEGAERVLGLTSDVILGKPRAAFAPDRDESQFSAYREKIAKREPFRDLPFTAKHPKTGKYFHVYVSGEPVFEDGVFIGFQGVGRNVTEEKEMLRELTALAAENQALVENSLDAITQMDASGVFVRVSGAATDVYGYEPAELLGKRYSDFLHPDDIPHAEIVRHGLATGEGTVRNAEMRWIRKDGRISNLSVSAKQALDTGMIYSIAKDVTESLQYQEKLQRINEQMHYILESIGDAFFAVDRDWRITYGNERAARFSGISREQVTGKTLMEAIPGIEKSEVFQYYENAMMTRQDVFFESFYEPAQAWVEVRVYCHDGGLSIFYQDITARRATEQVIRDSELRFKEMIRLTPAGYVAADGQGVLIEVNPAFCAMSGYSQEELVGQNLDQFVSSERLTSMLLRESATNFVHGKETELRHKQGHAVYVLANMTVKRDESGYAKSLTAFVTDITARKEVECQLEVLATHDMLTGLPNRTHVNRTLQSMLDNASPNESIAVLFIDLDRFKEVNDSLGHGVGDVLLQKVAQRLERHMRPTDVVARLGGDEFVVAARCHDGRRSAEAIAQKILTELSAPLDVVGNEVYVSASIGICMVDREAATKELLFQNADMAMYLAKASGRNTFCFFEAEMSARLKNRMALEQALRHAQERNEFELYFQPRINLKSMNVVGMEALIRWHHPELGTVSPADFIPIAEERGLIASIGGWVLDEACRQTQLLVEKYDRPLQVSVNLSAHQLKGKCIIQKVNNALQASKLPAKLLELELTETALIEDMDHSVQVLKDLKSFGLALSVDDFGTGYSSLAYLKRFPIDILKLDRSFINQSPEGVTKLEFVRALVDLAHALKLSVVAEGIETNEMLELLTEARCDEGQGYLFAKPMPLSELEKLLTTFGGLP